MLAFYFATYYVHLTIPYQLLLFFITFYSLLFVFRLYLILLRIHCFVEELCPVFLATTCYAYFVHLIATLWHQYHKLILLCFFFRSTWHLYQISVIVVTVWSQETLPPGNICLARQSLSFSGRGTLRMFACLFWFYGISTFVGYLMPNPFLYK